MSCERMSALVMLRCGGRPQHVRYPLGLLGAGDLTMVLDFGSFALDSDANAAADLPAEEVALYMGFKLSARNISSFLVDGDFTWALLESMNSPGAKQNGVQDTFSRHPDALFCNSHGTDSEATQIADCMSSRGGVR